MKEDNEVVDCYDFSGETCYAGTAPAIEVREECPDEVI